MATRQQIACVRSALNDLDETLVSEYQRCALLSEGDVQATVVQHLKAALRRQDDRWMVCSTHTLGDCRPDVLCFYAPNTYQGFIEDYLHGTASLAAVIEIKWASSANDDLKKLSELQQRYRRQQKDILAWMIWGDHFAPAIHKANAARHLKIETAVSNWAARNRTLRGHTILNCGEIIAKSRLSRYAERLRALQTHWWINDREAKASALLSES